MLICPNVDMSESRYVRMSICPNVDKSCYNKSSDPIHGDELGYDHLNLSNIHFFIHVPKE